MPRDVQSARRRRALISILAVLLCTALAPTSRPAASAAQSPRVVTIGAVLNGATGGDPDTQVAVRMAVDDVNAYFAALGAGARVGLEVENTGLEPEAAVAAARRLSARGVRVAIGPESSPELRAILDAGAAEGMALVSHCSTSPGLAIPGDAVFRLVPDDNAQAAALGVLIARAGVRAVVPVWRGDVFGDGLVDALRRELALRGIEMDEGVRFDPDALDGAAVAADLAARARAVAAARGRPDGIAVQFVGFGPDAPPVLGAAAVWPELATKPWFGTDGTAQSRELIGDERAARFAALTGFVNPLFAAPDTEKTRRIAGRIRAVAGTDPHVCALAAYDAVLLAAITALSTGEAGDVAAFARALPLTADAYFGATGWTALNAAGDRRSADYDTWVVSQEDGRYAWRRSGAVNAGEE